MGAGKEMVRWMGRGIERNSSRSGSQPKMLGNAGGAASMGGGGRGAREMELIGSKSVS